MEIAENYIFKRENKFIVGDMNQQIYHDALEKSTKRDIVCIGFIANKKYINLYFGWEVLTINLILDLNRHFKK